MQTNNHSQRNLSLSLSGLTGPITVRQPVGEEEEGKNFNFQLFHLG